MNELALLSDIGYFTFGLLAGALLIEARWRFKVSVMERMTGAEQEKRSWWGMCDDSTKQTMIIAPCICLGVIVLILSLTYYNLNDAGVSDFDSRTKAGYTYYSIRPEGWYRDGKKIDE